MNKFTSSLLISFNLTLSFLISPTALAHSSQKNQAHSNAFLTTPSLPGGFGFTLGALLLKPDSGYLDYAVFTKPFPILTPDWQVKSINPEFGASSDVELFYQFPHTANEIRAHWLHLNTSDSDTTTAGGSDFVAPQFQAGPAGGVFTRASSNNKFYFDTVQLNLSQLIDITKWLRIKLFAGADFARIKQSLTTFYENNGPTIGFTTDNLSDFIGAGPDFGLSTEMSLPRGFSLISQIRTSLLVGSMQTRDNFNLFNPTIQAAGTSPINQSITTEYTVPLVPGVDSKLGFGYTHSLGKRAKFSVELGYKFSVYLNGINQVYPTALVTALGTTTAAVSTLTKSIYNFSVNGPYITISFYDL